MYILLIWVFIAHSLNTKLVGGERNWPAEMSQLIGIINVSHNYVKSGKIMLHEIILIGLAFLPSSSNSM